MVEDGEASKTDLPTVKKRMRPNMAEKAMGGRSFAQAVGKYSFVIITCFYFSKDLSHKKAQ